MNLLIYVDISCKNIAISPSSILKLLNPWSGVFLKTRKCLSSKKMVHNFLNWKIHNSLERNGLTVHMTAPCLFKMCVTSNLSTCRYPERSLTFRFEGDKVWASYARRRLPRRVTCLQSILCEGVRRTLYFFLDLCWIFKITVYGPDIAHRKHSISSGLANSILTNSEKLIQRVETELDGFYRLKSF
jgi:hypothetical protein